VSHHAWPLTLDEIGEITNAWSKPEDGAMITWAVWAVDGLHHLLDLDDRIFGVTPRELHGFTEEAVDLAHARWASASAITALDLCATTLGRRRIGAKGTEYSLRDFDKRRSKSKKVAVQRIGQLEPQEQSWVKAATSDQDYATALKARNPLIHGRLKRTLYGSMVPPGPHEDRTGFPVGPGGAIVDSRPLIELCASVAARHVESFLRMIKAEHQTTTSP
jgi:hypothetical protein